MRPSRSTDSLALTRHERPLGKRRGRASVVDVDAMLAAMSRCRACVCGFSRVCVHVHVLREGEAGRVGLAPEASLPACIPFDLFPPPSLRPPSIRPPLDASSSGSLGHPEKKTRQARWPQTEIDSPIRLVDAAGAWRSMAHEEELSQKTAPRRR